MRNSQVVQSWYYGQKRETEHLFTDGVTIWSYGYHFPIATKQNGKIYFNTDNYSNTTGTHKGHVARCLGYNTSKELIKAIKAGCASSEIHLTDTEQLKILIQ